MAFAIFYELSDLSAIAGTTQSSALPNADDPVGACPLCRVVVISGTGNTLADFRQMLLDIANFFGTDAARYLIALSADMGVRSGAIEPWP